jgi:PAS domain S-box-containing protein
MMIYQVETFAGMCAAAVLTLQYLVPSFLKKTSYVNLGYAVAALLAAQTILRLDELFSASVPASDLISQSVTNAILVAAAFVHPLIRRTAGRQRFDELQEVNTQLRRRKQVFEAFMNEVPGLVFMKGQDGRLLYLNDHAKRLFNIDMSSTISQSQVPLQLPDIDISKEELRRQARDSGEKSKFTQVLTINNIQRTMTVSTFPLTGPQGESLVGGIAIDMTDQLESKIRTEALAAIVRLSPDAIYCIEEDGTVVFWNEAAERLYGYSKEEMIGQSIKKVVPAHLHDEMDQVRAITRDKGEVRNYETIRVGKDGIERQVAISTSHIVTSDEKVLCALSVRDISQLKQIEKRIDSLNKALTEGIKELFQTNEILQQARDEALKAANVKSAFVANISHELRTPLGGITGMSELALREEPLTDDERHMIELIHNSANALLKLVNNILDLSKLEAGKMKSELELFAADELIQECLVLVRPAAASKELTITTAMAPGVPEMLNGDRDKIRHVTLALLDNAVKYTVEGSIGLEVSAERTETDKSRLRIAVKDTGVGIAPEDAGKVFAPFSTVATPGRAGGVGLGLALAKRMVELMNGEIAFESELGRGSTFWVSIPFQHTGIKPRVRGTTSSGQRRIVAQGLSRFSVLSVEDDHMLSKLILRQLQAIGVSTDSACSVAEAVEKASAKCFDIIFMDMHLPDGLGCEAVREIRALQRDAAKPSVIIAMTAGVTPEERDEALQAGMDEFISKPISFERLRETVLNWLAER